jgi:hypothetical protein
MLREDPVNRPNTLKHGTAAIPTAEWVVCSEHLSTDRARRSSRSTARESSRFVFDKEERMNRLTPAVAAIASLFAMGVVTACGDDDGPSPDGGTNPPDGSITGLPTEPPSTFESVVNSGFQSPTDAVASPDGSTFYFAAYDMEGVAALYSVPSDGSAAPTTLYSGDLLVYPSGLVLDCNGATLYVADPTGGAMGTGAIYSLTLSPLGELLALDLGELQEPNALAVTADCSSLVASGRASSGEGAVARLPIAGGESTILAMGGSIVAPTGVYVDGAGVVWLLDHLAEGEAGEGVLFSVDSAGTVAEVGSGFRLGTPGGVSLTAGGGTAVVGGRDASGAAVLTSIDIASGEATTIALPTTFVSPAGLRTARAAGVFVFVDSEGSAIYRGE